MLLLQARSAQAATVTKANNANDLNLSSSWGAGGPPETDDIGRWNSTVTGPNTVSLGANLSWAGIQIVDPGGPVIINAGNTLTLGTSGIVMSTATQDLTLNNDVILGATQTWNVKVDRTITVNGDISGTGQLTKIGDGLLVVTGANTFSGGVIVSDIDTDAFTGALRVIDTTGYAGDATISHNGLGTGPVTLIGGTLELRVNGAEDAGVQTLSYGNDLIVQSGVVVDVNRASGLGTNKTLTFNSLTIGSNQLAVTGGNGYALSVGEVTMLDSGAEFVPTTGSLKLGTLSWDDAVENDGVFTLGGTASGNAVTGLIKEGFNTSVVNVVKTGSSTWTLNGAGTLASGESLYTGTTEIKAGTVIVTGSQALGTDDGGTIVSNTGSLHLENNVTITGEFLQITGDGASPLQSTGDNTWTGDIEANTNSGITTRITSNSGTLTLDGDIYMNNETEVDVIFVLGGSGTTVVNGEISALDEHSVLYRSSSGNGTVILNAANTFTGNTVISGGAFQLGNQDALQFSTLVANAAGGLKFSEGVGTFTLGGLTGTNIVLEDVGGSAITLEVGNNDSSSAYNGRFSGGGSLVKIGDGTFTLGGANSYSGSTSVNGGVLSFSSSANLGDESVTNTLGIDGGTLRYTGSGTTDLTANRDVTLGAGTATIEVSDANGLLIVSGDVTGAGGDTFSKTGAGTLVLAGSSITGLNNRGLSIEEGGLSFINGVGRMVSLGANVLQLADGITLSFEVGSMANFDSIASTSAASIASGATINLGIASLTGIAVNSTYDLLTGGNGSGFNAAGLTYRLSVSGDYQYQLNLSDTTVQLQTLAAVSATPTGRAM